MTDDAAAPMLSQPTDRLLGVLDDPAHADAVVAALVDAGIERDAIEILSGSEAADTFDGSGERHGLLEQLWRSLQLQLTDQIGDLSFYQKAAEQGRAIVSVAVADRDVVVRAVDALKAADVHFINHYGTLQTEEFTPWRGEIPDVPPAVEP